MGKPAMPKTSPFTIVITDEQRAVLESRVRKYTSSYIDVVRAKIVLYAAEGMENKDIAARLDTSFQIVCKWRKRFVADHEKTYFSGHAPVSRIL
jgi:transposase-like protein